MCVRGGCRGALQGASNHIGGELSLFGKKRGPGLTVVGKEEGTGQGLDWLLLDTEHDGGGYPGFRYKRRCAHFPITVVIQKDGSLVEI